jgi:hypothetical protein
MAIPNLVPLIKPLCDRFPSAWAKAKAPHDDGEFNARVCAVLYYEQGLTAVGRNGKRGNPTDLSRDIINWKGEGPNPDPVNGGFGTIIDFIASHESPSASIAQFYPDPNGPGAWVKPLTLAQIDAGAPPVPPSTPPVAVYPGDLYFIEKVGMPLEADYALAGQQLNAGSATWFGRTIFDAVAGALTMDASVAKHRAEWRAALGLPPV